MTNPDAKVNVGAVEAKTLYLVWRGILTYTWRLTEISKIQLVVYYQCCILIGWAATRLYVIAH